MHRPVTERDVLYDQWTNHFGELFNDSDRAAIEELDDEISRHRSLLERARDC